MGLVDLPARSMRIMVLGLNADTRVEVIYSRLYRFVKTPAKNIILPMGDMHEFRAQGSMHSKWYFLCDFAEILGGSVQAETRFRSECQRDG